MREFKNGEHPVYGRYQRAIDKIWEPLEALFSGEASENYNVKISGEKITITELPEEKKEGEV